MSDNNNNVIDEVVERPNIDNALQEIKKKPDIAQILLEKVKSEKKEKEEKRQAKKKAKEFVNRVFASLNCVATRKIKNPKTNKIIGQKFRYINDKYGNSIYDYLEYNKDAFQRKIIEKCWKIRYDPNDNKDGGWIDERVDITWVNKDFVNV